MCDLSPKAKVATTVFRRQRLLMWSRPKPDYKPLSKLELDLAVISNLEDLAGFLVRLAATWTMVQPGPSVSLKPLSSSGTWRSADGWII
ncbi:hypothetical protein J6590_042840 [Homalodisca vitripennis]|nr:hypothetical protein J6590_042840 [Homalodisca vitripennis]